VSLWRLCHMTPPSKWRGGLFLLADELDKAVHILKQIASHRVYTRLCNGVSRELAIGYSPLFPAGPSFTSPYWQGATTLLSVNSIYIFVPKGVLQDPVEPVGRLVGCLVG